MTPSRSIPLLLMLIFPFWGLFTPPALAQEADSLILQGKEMLYEGYNQNRLDQLQRARALFVRVANGEAHAALAHYYAGLAQYRALNLAQGDEDRALRFANDGIKHLQKAAELQPDFAEAYALLSGLYGQKTGLKPSTAMTLGPKATRTMARANDLAPNSPRVVLIDGTSDYFKPSMFGGDKEAALEKFECAAELAENESVDDPLQPDWGHAEAYAWIGYAHMEAGRTDAARKAFEHALKINPDFGWVKHELLPRLASAE